MIVISDILPKSGQEHFPENLVCEIADCLPAGIVECVALPAIGTGRQLLAVRIDPNFYLDMAAAAKYWLALIDGLASFKAIA